MTPFDQRWSAELDAVYVVRGYSCHLTPTTRRYVQRASDLIRSAELAGKSVGVITSGGFTSRRSAPGRSEAALLADALKDDGVQSPVLRDEGARTTVENLRGAVELLEHHRLEPARVVIICDHVRVAKIGAVWRHLARERWPTQLAPVDMNRSRLAALLQRSLAVWFDTLVVRWPALERASLAIVRLKQAAR